MEQNFNKCHLIPLFFAEISNFMKFIIIFAKLHPISTKFIEMLPNFNKFNQMSTYFTNFSNFLFLIMNNFSFIQVNSISFTTKIRKLTKSKQDLKQIFISLIFQKLSWLIQILVSRTSVEQDVTRILSQWSPRENIIKLFGPLRWRQD